MSVNDMMPQDNLPEWMQRAQRPVDWGALLILGFCLLASFSFINQYTFPATNDSEHYAFQAQDFAQAFDEGLVYTRWSPYALHGYGAPIQHYYPPSIGYVSGLLTYFFTNDVYIALRVIVIASFLLAGSTMYTFMKQEVDALAGLIAGCAYIFSPFVMVTVPHIQGDLPMVISMALVPTLMWAVSRFWHRNLAIDFPLVACVVGAIVLTAPILIISVSLVVVLLLYCYLRTERLWWRVANLCGAIFVGVGLSAFYWLPAWYSLEAVTWYPSFLGVYRFTVHWWDYFAPLAPISSDVLIPQPILALGWGFLGVLAINLISKVFQRTHLTLTVTFLGLGMLLLGAVALFDMTTTLVMPLLLVGIFCLCISASTLATHQQSILWTGLGGVMLIALILSSIPIWLLPTPTIVAFDTTLEDRLSYEADGNGISGLPRGTGLPSTLAPNYAQRNQLRVTQDTPFLIRDAQSISNLSIGSEDVYRDTLTYLNNSSRSITYNRAYFEGWQAFPTGLGVTVNASENNLLQVQIPANTDTTITIRMGTTSVRLIAWVISISTVTLMSIVWWWRWRQVDRSYDNSKLLRQKQTYMVFGILIMVVAIRGYADFLPEDWTSQPDNAVLSQSTIVRNDINRQFELIGFDLPQSTLHAGDTLTLQTFWGVIFIVDEQYVVQLQLRNQRTGEVVVRSLPVHPAHFPTNRWVTGIPVSHTFMFTLPDDLTPDLYRLVFDVYVCDTQCNIHTVENDSAIAGQITLPTVVRIE